ncbi:hypothetical protein FRB99_006457 [Tulasnella sp. 403]|nr:hypothetical protein FRB99_006457 [Tulasnella sp. 403]
MGIETLTLSKVSNEAEVRIVEDLVPLIVEQGEPWEIADLARLTMVSSAWRYHVEKLLYTKVELKSRPQLLHFTRTLEARRDLARLVLSLRFEVVAPPDNTRAMQKLFKQLCRLESLRTSGSYGIISLMEALEQLPEPERLKELEVVGPPLDSRVLPRMMDRTITWTEKMRCRNITSLSLSRVYLTFRMPPDARGFPPKLTSLCLEDAEVTNLVSLRHFPPLHSLTIVTPLVLYTDPFSQIRVILPHIRESIEELSHTMIRPARFWAHATPPLWQMPLCPNLKLLETDARIYTSRYVMNLDDALPSVEVWTERNMESPGF